METRIKDKSQLSEKESIERKNDAIHGVIENNFNAFKDRGNALKRFDAQVKNLPVMTPTKEQEEYFKDLSDKYLAETNELNCVIGKKEDTKDGDDEVIILE